MKTINRMSRGVVVLAGGVKPLLWPGDRREALARWFILAVAGSLLLTSMALYAWPAYVALGALLLAAYSAGDDGETAEGQEDETEKEEESEEDPFAYSPEDVVEMVWELIGDRNGVLLSQIREQLQAETGIVWSSQDVRALLAEASVPVRPGVRVRGVGNSTGVHRDDVPPLPSHPSPAAPVGVVDAGQTANTNTNNTAATAHVLPDGGVIVSTPDDGAPHRTRVQHIPREGVSKA